MKREVTISAVRKIIHDSRYTNATNSNEIDRISLENFTNLTRNIFDAVQKIHLWCTFVGACLRVKIFLIELLQGNDRRGSNHWDANVDDASLLSGHGQS